VSVSEEVAVLLEDVHQFLEANTALLKCRFSDADRRRFADFLGNAHTTYRNEYLQPLLLREKTTAGKQPGCIYQDLPGIY
jgi:hypothetical protein